MRLTRVTLHRIKSIGNKNLRHLKFYASCCLYQFTLPRCTKKLCHDISWLQFFSVTILSLDDGQRYQLVDNQLALFLKTRKTRSNRIVKLTRESRVIFTTNQTFDQLSQR